MPHGQGGVVGGLVESFKRAKMQKLEELLARQTRFKRYIEGGFCYGYRTLDQIDAGWDLFYRLQNQMGELALVGVPGERVETAAAPLEPVVGFGGLLGGVQSGVAADEPLEL